MPRAGDFSTKSLPAGPASRQPDRVELLGVPVDRCTRQEALARCEAAIAEASDPLQIVTLNPEMVMQARRQPELRRAIRDSGLVLADGAGVVWACRRLGAPVPERIAGVDFLGDLAEMARQHVWSVFLLGAGPGVAEAAAKALKRDHPGLLIGGTWEGSACVDEAQAICARVQESGAQVLAVAFGVPKQDLWLSRHLSQSGALVGIGVGGSLDYLAGQVPRAPLLLRRLGLEWTFRLVRQPWRLPRMLRAAPFFWETISDSRKGTQA
ncbi:MAG: WecB/TagA/CpsF family glycosyltransferase [Candidatus Dormiibacterota bacterium]